jgi:hypothetical protein
MLRLSSQSKSTPWDELADTRATGMCTRPKLIAPFQIALAIGSSSNDWVMQKTQGWPAKLRRF